MKNKRVIASLAVAAALSVIALCTFFWLNQWQGQQENASSSDVPVLKVSENLFIDSDTVVTRLVLNDCHSKIEIKRQMDSSDYEIASGAYIDFSKQEMGIYKACLPNEYEEAAVKCKITMKPIKGHQYSAYFAKKDSLSLKLTLVDDYSGQSVELFGDTTNGGIGWGKRSYTVVFGDITVKEFFDLSDQPYNAKVGIIGDSFVEGNSLLDERGNRYSYLIKDYLHGDAFINGKGGAGSGDGVKWMHTYLLDVVKPKYMIIAFGMNEINVSKWRRNIEIICLELKQKEITPVLVTITPTENENYANQEHMKMNEYIRSSGYLYIDAAKACSLHHDGVSFDSELFMSDKVHPNIQGHRVIFEQAKKDVPVIFE